MAPAQRPATVCVLGGSGFVGSRLVARLAARGHQVIVPTRHAPRAAHLRVMPTVRVIAVDIHDPQALTSLVAGCDAVVNLVGILNERGRDGSGFQRAHTELAGTLVRAMATGNRKLVQMSALAADAQHGPSHYLRSKGAAESLIREASGLRWTILRPSVIFGPGDSFTNRFARLLTLLPVFPLAMPGARFAPVYLDDVVAVVERALTDPGTDHQCYELGGPEELSLREIVGLIARALGRRRLIIGLPRGLSRLQAAIMDFLPGKPFSTDNFHSLTIASTPAEDGFAALGMRPQSFTALLPATLDQLRMHSRLDLYRKAAGR